MKKYKVLKGIWKAARTVGIAAGSFLLCNYQEIVPAEYLTPVTILVLEFARNLIFGKHDKAIVR